MHTVWALAKFHYFRTYLEWRGPQPNDFARWMARRCTSRRRPAWPSESRAWKRRLDESDSSVASISIASHCDAAATLPSPKTVTSLLTWRLLWRLSRRRQVMLRLVCQCLSGRRHPSKCECLFVRNSWRQCRHGTNRRTKVDLKYIVKRDCFKKKLEHFMSKKS